MEGILGMRPDFYGLHVAPSIPKEWDELQIDKVFRGRKLHIVVRNPLHVESGCASLTVNGKLMEGDYIPESAMDEVNEVELILG